MSQLVPAVYAADVVRVRNMLSRDPDCADQLDSSGECPLHHAVHNLSDKLKLFYESTQPDHHTVEEQTIQRESEIVLLIVNAMKETRLLLDKEENNPLMILGKALQKTDGPCPDLIHVFDALITPQNINNRTEDLDQATILILAVLAEDWRLVKHLLTHHNPDLLCSSRAPRHPTAHSVEMAIHHATFYNRIPVDVLDLLITEETMNQISILGGLTPLHYACRNGNEAFIKLFLNRGANVNIENATKQCALAYYFIYHVKMDDLNLIERMIPEEPMFIYRAILSILFIDTDIRKREEEATKKCLQILYRHMRPIELEEVFMEKSSLYNNFWRVNFYGKMECGSDTLTTEIFDKIYDTPNLLLLTYFLVSSGCEIVNLPAPILPQLPSTVNKDIVCQGQIIDNIWTRYKNRKKRTKTLLLMSASVVRNHIQEPTADNFSELGLPRELQYLVSNGHIVEGLMSIWRNPLVTSFGIEM